MFDFHFSLETIILIYFFVANTSFGALLVGAAIYTWRHTMSSRLKDFSRVIGSNLGPRITIIVPAHNEAVVIAESVQSFLALYYPNLEVVVINDGSSDDTLDVLIRQFELRPYNATYDMTLETQRVRGLYRSARHPNLVVVDKEGGGKPDALNAGLNMARGYLICAVDSDTLVEPDALKHLVIPFLEDENTVASGAFLGVVNGSGVRRGRVETVGVPRQALPGIQFIEYIRGFALGRVGWNLFGGNLIISGAFGLFKREQLMSMGGYTDHTPGGEDMELVLHLRRYGYEHKGPGRIAFVPIVAAWTEVPGTLRTLGRQRDRWHRGLAYVLWHHRRVAFNPRYRTMGLLTYPYFLTVELLGPLLEAFGLGLILYNFIFGKLDLSFAFNFFIVAYLYSMLLTTVSILLMELGQTMGSHRLGYRDLFLLAKWIALETIGFRQLTLFWRLRGLVGFFRGQRAWGAMVRHGFENQEPDTEVRAN